MNFNTAFSRDKINPPKDEQENYEQVFKDLFENEIQPSKEEKELQAKNLRLKGFQLSSTKDATDDTALKEEVSGLKDLYNSTTSKWNEYFASYVSGMSERYSQLNEEVKAIQDKQSAQNSKIEVVNNRKEEIKKEIEDLRRKATTIQETFSQSSKGIGEALIDHSELELNKVVQLQEGIHAKVKKIYNEQYEHRKLALDAYVLKLQSLRQEYEERLNPLKERMTQLTGNGINHAVARNLIVLGSTLAGVAGFFFAIFCKSADYSSDDLLSYLVQSVIGATIKSTIPFYEKFAYLLGFIIIVTGVSWLINNMPDKEDSRVQNSNEDDAIHQLRAEFEIEGIQYTLKTKEKKWFPVWVKIAPVLLIVGTLILLISSKAGAEGDVKDLSAATEGLLIGTAIAMGLSAAIYVYITNVVEPRILQSGLKQGLKANRELALVILLFLVCLVVFAFYKIVKVRGIDFTGTYSIVGFIGSCLVAAISLAYGLRYSGLLSVEIEVRNAIIAIDKFIYFSSFPTPPAVDMNLQEYYEVLNKGLVACLDYKNTSAFPNYKSDIKTGQFPTYDKRFSPPPRKQYPSGQGELLESTLFIMLDWEIWTYPEYAQRIRFLENLYKTKSEELSKAEIEQKRLTTELEEKNRIEVTTLQKLQSQKGQIQRYILKAKKYQLRKAALISLELETAISHLQDGFNLGLWYRQQDAI